MVLSVNGKEISEDSLEAEFASIKAYFESLGNVSCCERDEEFRGYARENLVARALLSEEAQRRLPASSDAEIDAAVDEMKQEQGEFQFAAMVATSPGQIDGLREDIASNIRTQKLLADLWADLAEPTDTEVRAFYDRNIKSFMSPEQVRASHISKNPGQGETRESVYQTMRGVRTRLIAGEDFDSLAREFSDKGKEQIDLGFFKRGDLPEEFELVTFSMEVGELSPVFASQYGFHIARVTGKKTPEPAPFDEVATPAKQALVEEHRKEKTQSLVDQLKKTAVIKGDYGLPESAFAAPRTEEAVKEQLI